MGGGEVSGGAERAAGGTNGLDPQPFLSFFYDVSVVGFHALAAELATEETGCGANAIHDDLHRPSHAPRCPFCGCVWNENPTVERTVISEQGQVGYPILQSFSHRQVFERAGWRVPCCHHQRRYVHVDAFAPISAVGAGRVAEFARRAAAIDIAWPYTISSRPREKGVIVV
jgi:hypothetical protein